MNQKELLEKKNDLVTRAEETLNKAKAENRELTDAEMAEQGTFQVRCKPCCKQHSFGS